LVERHLVERHLAERNLAERHLHERYLAERHLVERHLAERTLAERYLAERSLMLSEKPTSMASNVLVGFTLQDKRSDTLLRNLIGLFQLLKNCF